MLPFFLPKLRLSKTSVIQTLSALRQFKTSKVYRPLAVSASAAIQKPKAIARHRSPAKKLQKKRLVERMKKLGLHWQESTEPTPQPPNPVRRRSPLTRPLRSCKPKALQPLKKLKSVAEAKVKKVDTNIKTRLEKRKFLKRFRSLRAAETTSSATVKYELSLKSTDPSKPYGPGKTIHVWFVDRNTKLKVTDSKFAYSGFRVSKIKPLTIDDPEQYRASMEAHLEMKHEIALASDPEMYDTLIASATRPFEASMVVEYPSNMEVDVNDIEMEIDEQLIVNDVEMEDVAANVQVWSNAIVGTSPGTHTAFPTQYSYPAQAQTHDATMLDVVTAPAPARPMPSASTNYPIPTRIPGLRFQYPPKKSSGLRNVMSANSSPPFTPHFVKNSLPIQVPAAPNKATNKANDKFNIAAHPPPDSSRGCQRKPAVPAVKQSNQAARTTSTTSSTRKPLAPPPGARRATSMNLIKIV